ncbi:AIPR family protein [Flavobacterium plurextorum]|uniref:AIPR family protein n=1 Tax=Flavobacterium TaxID=237 RepID=UPI00214D69D3|nr:MULTISPECIES: AIPR family protein [Flavobacterium]UUW11325.1 AIPR family protein [Flavobacterium plurextorum]
MDTITNGFLKDFVDSKNYTHFDISTQFEYFINFCVINKEYDSISFDEKEISTGKSTQGIDGIGIIVNNKLCNSVSEIKQLVELNRFLTVTFVIIQSKTSPKFDGSQIDNLLRWTKTYFSESPDLFVTNEMRNFIEMKEYIYSNSRFMKERSPICNLYFCSTGKWTDDPNLLSIIDSNRRELDNLNLFDTINFYPCDAKQIQFLYRKTKEPVEATIKFEKKVTIPSIPEIKVAYSGMLPFLEFKKIIIDDSGKMKSVFDDNIRDYLEQENNPVNRDISETLKNGDLDQFCILNNGVTIVAEEISGPGDTITIINYQIVNGCQTSNVLYENRNLPNINAMHVPIKIIVTDNYNIKSQITRATNNQTAVDSVELEALSEFQKSLEYYYYSLPTDDLKLYYERRTNQYKSNDDVTLNRIINRENQIKTLSAMFLDNPHNVAGNYGRLVSKIGEEIFNKDHEFITYYVSSLSYFKLENLLNRNLLSENSKRFRYQILMIFRFMVTKSDAPNLKDKGRINKICNQIIEVLKDEDLTLSIFKESSDFLESEELNLNFKDRKTVERKDTTELIIEKLKFKYLRT